MARAKYIVQEVPHPFKKGDKVLFACTKCVVKSTSWEGDVPFVGVIPYEDDKPPANLGIPSYKVRAVAIHPMHVVDRLGDLSDD